MRVPKGSSRFGSRYLLLALVVALLLQPVAASAGGAASPDSGVPQLSAEAAPKSGIAQLLDSVVASGAPGGTVREAARLSREDDGYLSALGAPPGSYFPVASPLGSSPETLAWEFLTKQGKLFGITSDRVDFTVSRVRTGDSRSYVRLQQTYAGIPVLGGEIIVQTNPAGGVESVLSDIMRGTEALDLGEVGTLPAITASDAQQAAVALLRAANGPGLELQSTEPALVIYEPSVVGNTGPARLVWQTSVLGPEEAAMDEAVLVDARTGEVAFHYPLVERALSRQVYDANETFNDPGTLVRSEGGNPSGIADANQAYDYLGDAWNFYNIKHGRDSVNGAGQVLSVTVRYGTSSQDTAWHTDSERIYLFAGDAVDDVVAHEYTHGVTQHESNLLYFNQSGAISESLSDMWGEWIDQTYAHGNEPPGLWVIGEDRAGGAFRSMWDPPAGLQPDRMGSPLWYTGQDQVDFAHINDGVGNKLAFLLTQGDEFNSYYVQGMGIDAVADLFYEVQTNLLSSAASYNALGHALKQAAVNLGWTASQRDNLDRASRAVEIVKAVGNSMDVDGDGRADVAATDADGRMWMYGAAELTNPAGTIDASEFGLGHPAWRLESGETWDKVVGVGDVNGDGRADVVVTNGNGLMWMYSGAELMNKATLGDPNYVDATELGYGHPDWLLESDDATDKALGAGDINGDGLADVVVTNGNGLMWMYSGAELMNKATLGDPNYVDATELGYGHPAWLLQSNETWDKAVGVGDVDGDGRADVVVTNGNGLMWMYSGAELMNKATLGDLGYIDATELGYGVWRLESDETWDQALGVGDADADGRADIVVTNGDGFMWMYTGAELMNHATLGDPGLIDPKTLGLGHPQWLVESDETWDKALGAADVNDDGHEDVVVTNGNGLMWMYSGAELITPTTLGSPHPVDPRVFGYGHPDWLLQSNETHDWPLGVGDINRDGYADIVVTNSDGLMWMYSGVELLDKTSQLDPNYVDRTEFGPGHPDWLIKTNDSTYTPLGVGDIDGDGRADIVFTNSVGDMLIYSGAELMDKTTLLDPNQINPTLYGPGLWPIRSGDNWDKPLGVGDVDGDGLADIVVTNPDGYMWMYRGAELNDRTTMGGPNDIDPWSFGPGLWPIKSRDNHDWPMGVGDVDGDGRADILVTNSDGLMWMYSGAELMDHATLGQPNVIDPTVLGPGLWLIQTDEIAPKPCSPGFGWGRWW